MQLSVNTRLIGVVMLLVALFALLVVGGIDRPPAPELGDYAGVSDITEHPNTYQNQPVSFVGEVIATDPLVVEATYPTNDAIETVQFRITNVDATVDKDDRIQIFGVLIEPHTIQANNIVVIPQTGRWYAWGVSSVAGLWVLVRIIRHWSIDTATGAFVPRSEVVQVLDREEP